MKLGPYELGYNDTNQGIYTGDAKLLCEEIPDESIDLIFTDPVYQRMDDYAWLAEMASRKLKPNSALLTFCGIGYLPETMRALTVPGLSYRWRLLIRTVYSKEFHGRLCVMTQECLWYEKGKSRLRQTLFEFNYSTHKGLYDMDGANWGKGLDSLLRYVESFAQPEAITMDPFCGGGSIPAACKMLSRPYLAFEIEPQTATIAQQRLASTPIPLPGITPTQPKLL